MLGVALNRTLLIFFFLNEHIGAHTFMNVILFEVVTLGDFTYGWCSYYHSKFFVKGLLNMNILSGGMFPLFKISFLASIMSLP